MVIMVIGTDHISRSPAGLLSGQIRPLPAVLGQKGAVYINEPPGGGQAAHIGPQIAGLNQYPFIKSLQSLHNRTFLLPPLQTRRTSSFRRRLEHLFFSTFQTSGYRFIYHKSQILS